MGNLRRRVEKLEGRLHLTEKQGPKLPIYYWEPTDPESTRFVYEHIFNLPHPERKFEIKIVGEPDQAVFDKLAEEILPDLSTHPTLSSEEKSLLLDKYYEAAHEALNESRKKKGLTPV